MAAAMASPAPSSARKRHHPPYNQMIHRAIESLKERSGSSRTAIYKFIAANYSDLPPAHGALLSTHIRRLCKKGVLRMVKHSYMLAPTPTSAGAPTPGLRPRGRPPKSKGQNTVSIKRGRPRKSPGADLVPPAERKRRGRPPKSTGGDPVPPAERGKRVRPSKSLGADLVPPAERGKRGRPRKFSGAADPVRKPGRPPKTPIPASTVLPAEMRKRGRPLKYPGAGPLPPAEKRKLKPGPQRKLFSVNPVLPAKRRKPGRPPKTPPSAPMAASTEMRKPGRPRKVPQAATVPDSGAIKRRGLKPGRSPMHAAMKALVQKRKPGRPKKALSAMVVSGSGIPGPVNASVAKRKLGRPKKGVQHEVKPMSAAVKASVGKKKPGRPKKVLSPFPSAKAVDGSPSLLNQSQQLPEKVAGEGEPGLNPMPAPAKTSSEKRKPGRPKKAISSSSSVLGVVDKAQVDKAQEIVELGPEPMPAVVTTSVEKMIPDSPSPK